MVDEAGNQKRRKFLTVIGQTLARSVLAASMEEHRTQERDGHLKTDSTIRDVLTNPAFADFGRLLLPWDNHSYDENMRLSDIGSLLPYHSHVEPRACRQLSQTVAAAR